MTTPDWPAVEAAYRAGKLPVAEVAHMHGISVYALYSRARMEQWPQRRPRLRVGPERTQHLTLGPADTTMRMLARLTKTLGRHITDLEDAARAPDRSERDREREAKALAALAAVLDRVMELADRLSANNAAAEDAPDSEETARRHELLIAALAERVAGHRAAAADPRLPGSA